MKDAYSAGDNEIKVNLVAQNGKDEVEILYSDFYEGN